MVVTGALKRGDRGPVMTGSVWSADLSGGYGSVTLTAEGDSLFVSLDRSGSSETGIAHRLVMTEELRSIAEQPLEAGEVMKIEAVPGSGKTTAIREWCRVRTRMNNNE